MSLNYAILVEHHNLVGEAKWLAIYLTQELEEESIYSTYHIPL